MRRKASAAVIHHRFHEAISFANAGSAASSSKACLAMGLFDFLKARSSNSRLSPCDLSLANAANSPITASVAVAARATARPSFLPEHFSKVGVLQYSETKIGQAYLASGTA